MRNVTVKLGNAFYTVRLDSDGQPDLTDCSFATRAELAAKIRITRYNVVLPDNRLHTYLRGCIDGHDCTGHNIDELLAAYAARVECIDYVTDPVDAARRASIILAGDYGYGNRIESSNGRDYDVVTDNGKRFRFCQERSY